MNGDSKYFAGINIGLSIMNQMMKKMGLKIMMKKVSLKIVMKKAIKRAKKKKIKTMKMITMRKRYGYARNSIFVLNQNALTTNANFCISVNGANNAMVNKKNMTKIKERAKDQILRKDVILSIFANLALNANKPTLSARRFIPLSSQSPSLRLIQLEKKNRDFFLKFKNKI